MSIPYVVDGETDLDSALFNPIIDRIEGLADGTVPIALAGIEGALPQYGPLRAVRTPFEFGGIGDGATDDYNAIMSAYEALPATGGVLDLAGRKWYSSQTLDFGDDKPLTIDGRVIGSPTFWRPTGGSFWFPDEIDGLIIRGTDEGAEKHVALHNLGISTFAPEAVVAPGTGNGLTIRTGYANINRVLIHGFGGHGLYVPSDPVISGANANVGTAIDLAVKHCGGDGIHLTGSDSNVWTFIHPDVVVNSGYGIYNSSLHQNTFIGVHAAENILGDYYDDSLGSLWLMPYSEMENKFVIGPNSSGGTLITSGYGSPKIWYDDGVDITESAYIIHSKGWNVQRNGRQMQAVQVQANADLKPVFEVAGDSPNNNWFDARIRAFDGTTSLGSLFYAQNVSGANAALWLVANRLGFFGQTPTTQPAANADTSGATLGQLETEVNELKATLRTLGLIAT